MFPGTILLIERRGGALRAGANGKAVRADNGHGAGHPGDDP